MKHPGNVLVLRNGNQAPSHHMQFFCFIGWIALTWKIQLYNLEEKKLVIYLSIVIVQLSLGPNTQIKSFSMYKWFNDQLGIRYK